jgi:prepilin-type N-terminal cleavage/methylation domain-containing protein
MPAQMNFKIKNYSRCAGSTGFTLIELLVVLGIVGALAGVVLPNLPMTSGSQVRNAISNFASTARATYDSAILTNRVHRLVLKPKSGEYWAEAVPIGFAGRAGEPSMDANELAAKSEARAKLKEELDKAAAEPRKSAEDEKRFYSARSILVIRRHILNKVEWKEVDDAILYRHKLPGSTAFASIITDQMPQPLLFGDAKDTDKAYIYFFPSGEAQLSSVQIGIVGNNKQIEDNAAKFTLNVDPLSGRTEVLEGFIDSEFVSKKK